MCIILTCTYSRVYVSIVGLGWCVIFVHHVHVHVLAIDVECAITFLMEYAVCIMTSDNIDELSIMIQTRLMVCKY